MGSKVVYSMELLGNDTHINKESHMDGKKDKNKGIIFKKTGDVGGPCGKRNIGPKPNLNGMAPGGLVQTVRSLSNKEFCNTNPISATPL